MRPSPGSMSHTTTESQTPRSTIALVLAVFGTLFALYGFAAGDLEPGTDGRVQAVASATASPTADLEDRRGV